MTTLYFKTMRGLKEEDLEVLVGRHGEVVEACIYDFETEAWKALDPKKIDEWMLWKIKKEHAALDVECLHDYYQDQKLAAEG